MSLNDVFFYGKNYGVPRVWYFDEFVNFGLFIYFCWCKKDVVVSISKNK